LRCRPETAPFCPAWKGSRTTVERALRLIEGGALDGDGGTVGALAERVGVGARHLARLFAKYLGASPLQAAKTARVQRAKRLLDTTDLLVAQIALQAGFADLCLANPADVIGDSTPRVADEIGNHLGTKEVANQSSAGSDAASRIGGNSSSRAGRVAISASKDFGGVGSMISISASSCMTAPSLGSSNSRGMRTAWFRPFLKSLTTAAPPAGICISICGIGSFTGGSKSRLTSLLLERKSLRDSRPSGLKSQA